MSWKKTFVLALILIGVLVYIFKVELPSGEKREKEKQVLSGLSKTQLESIEISRKGVTFTLKNLDFDPRKAAAGKDATPAPGESAQRWTLLGVEGAEVDKANLNSLLNALVELKVDKPLAKDELSPDLAVYGLSEPEVKLKVAAGEGVIPLSKIELDWGKRNEYLSQRYLKVTREEESGAPSSDIYLVSETLFYAANKDKADFRKRNPIDITVGDIQRIDLRSKESGVIKLESVKASDSGAEPKTNWRLVEPISATASDSAVAELVRQLRNLRAKDFLDGEAADPEKLALNVPDLTLALEFKEELKKSPLEIRVSKKRGGASLEALSGKEEEGSYFLLSSAPTVFVLDKNPLQDLFKPLDSWRETQLFKFPVDRVESCEIRGKDRVPIRLEKEAANKWKANDKAADNAFVKQLLLDLSQLKAVKFPTGGRDFGFADPRLKVVVRLAGSVTSSSLGPDGGKSGAAAATAPELTLFVGEAAEFDSSRNESAYFAGVGDLSEPFIISKQSFTKIAPSLEVLQEISSSSSSSSVANDGS